MNEIIYVGKHALTLNVSRHAHNSWELIYVLTGQGTLRSENTTLDYIAGDIIIIPPFISHTNSSALGFTNYFVSIRDAMLTFKEPAIVKGNDIVEGAFAAAFVHFSGDGELRGPILSLYGDLLVMYMNALSGTRRHSDVVEEIEQSIIQNYTDADFNLEEYLRSFPFSYDYLRKIFKREVGVTPHRYLMDKRLQTAADRLLVAYSSDNITEVARNCGFREPLYFSRMFKKKYGVSPSRYIGFVSVTEADIRIDEDAQQ